MIAATREGKDVRNSDFAHNAAPFTKGGLQDADDQALVAQIATGNSAAFAVLVDRHANRHVAFAERVLGSRADAEDAVQDCFIKLWNQTNAFDPLKARFTTWFYRVVMNQCLDGKRRKSPVPLPENYDCVDDGPGPDAPLANQQLAQHVRSALNALPERQQMALTLTYYEELSNKDAAEVMELNIKALESLLLRARQALLKELKDDRLDLLDAMS